MKVYCTRCKILVGEILHGSKTRKGLKYLCTECHEAYKTLEGLKNYEQGTKGKGMDFPFFDELMKGMKK